MIKKLPWKNIIIVSSAMLVVPVMAYAITTAANPNEDANDENRNIKITADDSPTDAASAATSVLTSGALGYLDAATSATGQVQTGQGSISDAISSATVSLGITGTDAVSSATSVPGAIGSIEYDDDQYEDEQSENEEDDDEDEEDDD